MEENKVTSTKADLIKTIIGAALCVIFGFILICNIIIIVGGALNEERPPSVFGVTPLVVTTWSMETNDPNSIKKGDLIFLENVAYADLEIGDVITYKDAGSYTTHRIVGWDDEAQGFITKGDSVYNTSEDVPRITEDMVVGRVTANVHGIGDFILFLKKPEGMLLCIGLPIALYIGVDIFFRLREEKKKAAVKDDEKAAMQAELERLRALAGEGGNAEKKDEE